MGISVMDGVMLVGSPAESELLATALSPDCGELGPSPFMRESGVERHKIIKSIHLILRKRRSKYDNMEKIKQASSGNISMTVLLIFGLLDLPGPCVCIF